MNEYSTPGAPTGAARREYVPSAPPVSLSITPGGREASLEVLRTRPRGSVVHVTMVLGEVPYARLTFRPAIRGEEVFELESIPFVVDPPSRPYLEGATIEHGVEDGFAAFQIDGPNIPGAPEAPS